MILQAIDWQGYDEFKKNYIIRIYGITDQNESISVKVLNFKPYIYFKIPQNWIRYDVVKYIKDLKLDPYSMNIQIVKKKEFYGFTNDQYQKFAQLKFNTIEDFYNVKKLIQKPLYETKVIPILRFMHLNDIQSSGWMKVVKYDETNDGINCKHSIVADWNDIQSYDKSDIGKFVVASFDIECISADGSFPVETNITDKIIQIGTTFHRYGDSKCYLHHIITLKKCENIKNPNTKTIVESYNTESEVLMAWANLIERMNPDIITGYNINGFDFKYIYARTELCDCTKEFMKVLSRNKYRSARYIVKELNSSGLGDNTLKYIQMEGRIIIDIMKVIQGDPTKNLDNYKLNTVAKTFLGNQKVDLSPKEMFKKFRSGSPEDIREIAEYCIKDCELCNLLIIKLEIIANNVGMSNVCMVPLSYLFLRGQGIKIYSLVTYYANKKDFLIKNLNKNSADNWFEGAIVFEPQPDIYMDPIAVNDFKSLYPSSMISENISHDSIVWYKIYDFDDNILHQWGTEEYDNLELYNYHNIEYDHYNQAKVKIGKVVCRIAEHKDGKKAILPEILIHLLKARADTRKKINYKTINGKHTGLVKEHDDYYEINGIKIQKEDVKSIENTFSPFMKNILDGLQLAFKQTSNSLYGQLGAPTSDIYFKELGACTTATGRKMLKIARDETLKRYYKSKLVYGDSVTGETPIVLLLDDKIHIKTIESICTEWEEYKEEKEQGFTKYKVWSSNGKWAEIKRVIRHKTNKKIYGINTYGGYIEVTEDHSLLDHTNTKIKPSDCKVNETKLLYSNHIRTIEQRFKYNEIVHELGKNWASNMDYDKEIPISIINGNYNAKKNFMNGTYEVNEINIYSQKTMAQLSFIDNTIHKHDYSNNGLIISIEEIRTAEDEYVYDLETDNHCFHAGIGNIVVSNTDSIFVNFIPYIESKHGKTLTEHERMKYTSQYALESSNYITSILKKPQELEFEKILYPLILFSKKRYVSNKYEGSITEFKQNSMGIVLKRRDNAWILKHIYGNIVKIILNEKDIEKAKVYFIQSIQDLFDNKYDIKMFELTKSISKDYVDPTKIAHKVLANRMKERDPGNAPNTNDRIAFCYIDQKQLKCYECGKNNLSTKNCKCIGCMRLFCSNHLNKHNCNKVCRYCNIVNDIQCCYVCKGYFCKKCEHKCKKPLTNKILQGDYIETPEYIEQNGLKIDPYYYWEHQIKNPCLQIFELNMEYPEKLVEHIIRIEKNKKNHMNSITNYFKPI